MKNEKAEQTLLEHAIEKGLILVLLPLTDDAARSIRFDAKRPKAAA